LTNPLKEKRIYNKSLLDSLQKEEAENDAHVKKLEEKIEMLKKKLLGETKDEKINV